VKKKLVFSCCLDGKTETLFFGGCALPFTLSGQTAGLKNTPNIQRTGWYYIRTHKEYNKNKKKKKKNKKKKRKTGGCGTSAIRPNAGKKGEFGRSRKNRPLIVSIGDYRSS